MKKIVAIASMMLVTAAMADSITIEQQNQRVIGGAEDIRQYSMSYKRSLTNNLGGDVYISTTQAEETKKLGARLEVGLTPSMPVAGVVLSTRVALGSKYSNTGDTNYYVLEPSVQFPIAGNLKGKVAYRWRSGTGDATDDQTHTTRIGVSYALTKVDSIGVRFDRMRGDTDRNNVGVSYTRSF